MSRVSIPDQQEEADPGSDGLEDILRGGLLSEGPEQSVLAVALVPLCA